MKVYKFGGASVKDANAVRNLYSLIKDENSELIVVVSAMGKTTNRLECIWEKCISNKQKDAIHELENVYLFHSKIINNLNLSQDENLNVKVKTYLNELKEFIKNYNNENHAFAYDQIVSYGELFSTTIISHYFHHNGKNNNWLDARKLIVTSDQFQEARVHWGESQKNIHKSISNRGGIYITQGFIGANKQGQTTTLGREGSDYSAAILAWSVNANKVVIWKDVLGLLNADPKIFKNTEQLYQISFKEAIELSYLGASVIHPKTVKPLQNKGIPLIIRSFLKQNSKGSIIGNLGKNDRDIPSFIFKPNQLLISISTKDYSFIFEDHISELFQLFADFGLKVHLMQNSALNFSICGHIKSPLLPKLLSSLKEKYLVRYNEKVDLLSIRHYKNFELPEIVKNRVILIQQRSRSTIRYVFKK
jgi:aspartate kinase